MIERLADEAASGELIVASDTVEIHVYLLEGRLAWATTSTARRAFLQRLIEHHGIAPDALRDVIAECQRTRGRLGETLIGWGLASAAQVKDALAAQIVEALGAAAAHPAARTLFLPRHMAYDPSLTFAVDELVPPRSSGTLDERAATIVAAVLDSVPEAAWVEVAGALGALARAGRGVSRPAQPLAILQGALHEHAIDGLAVRASGGVVLGQRLPGQPASVWCVAGPDVKLGVASAVLSSAAGALDAPPHALPVGGPVRERPGAGMPPVLGQAMHTTDELVAALVIAADGEVAGCWRGSDEPGALAELARALASLLRARVGDPRLAPGDGFGYHQLALRAQRGAHASYGTLLAGGASLWLILPACASQGLGWALLQTVARQCADGARGAA